MIFLTPVDDPNIFHEHVKEWRSMSGEERVALRDYMDYITAADLTEIENFACIADKAVAEDGSVYIDFQIIPSTKFTRDGDVWFGDGGFVMNWSELVRITKDLINRMPV